MKVSVLMITYNHEPYIAQAIDSVLAQCVNFDYEVVIGEDCSTDRTRSIVLDFHRRRPDRIVPLLRDQNLGATRNFEATLAACRGQYLAFLEGDDYWACDQKLQTQIDFLEAHPDRALCCHRVNYLPEPGSGNAQVFPSHPAGSYTVEDLLEGNFVMTCSAVLRRDLIPPLPSWFSTMKLGDWPLFVLVATQGKIELLNETMAVYRLHGGSTWSSLPHEDRAREVARMLKALDDHLDFQYANTIRQTIARQYLSVALDALRGGNRSKTAEYLVSCLRNGGWRLSGSRRLLAGLAAYAIIGSWYKVFRRSKSVGSL